MEKPSRQERKRRIKAQNAEKKLARVPVEPPKPLTTEQREAVMLIAEGFIRLLVAPILNRNEFPSELDVE